MPAARTAVPERSFDRASTTMSSSAFTEYDRVAYPSFVHTQTFPEVLAVKGLLHGIDVAPPQRCRVLELGCGDGFNLAGMAVVYPGSAYTGIDNSTTAVARGRQLIEALALTQIRLEAADIRALDPLVPPLGEFDYVLAHGVYSWVPADVRDALLATIGRLLAPHGVAFVSYLTLPGAHLREAVRTMMRFHTRAEQDPIGAVRQARALVHLVAHGSEAPNPYVRTIADELALMEQHSDPALFHDELAEVNAPLLFTDFLAHAARHGLQFLAEAEHLIPLAGILTTEAREKLRPLEADPVMLEQYLDFFEGRRFRQSLLCRSGMGEKLETGHLDRLWVSSRLSPTSEATALVGDAPLEFHGIGRSILRAHTPLEKAGLLELAARSGDAVPFPTLLATIRERFVHAGLTIDDEFEPTLRQYLIRTYLPELIDLSWNALPYTLKVPQKPCAHPLARWRIGQGAPSGPNYLGRLVAVNGVLGQHLLSLLDGTRDHAALLAEMKRFLATEREAARGRGAAADLPSPDDPALPEQLEHSLQGLAGLGLVRRE